MSVTNLLVTIMSRGLPTLRKNCLMPQLVRSDFKMEMMTKGKTVDFPIPAALTVADVTPSSTPFASADPAPTTTQLVLDKWKHVTFKITDQELSQIDADKLFIPLEMEEAFKSLGEQVNSDLFLLYKDIYGYVGTAGTTPFATTVLAATNARRVLTQQSAPSDPRFGILDPLAMDNALALSSFADFQKSADANVITGGILGVKYGMRWGEDQQVPQHTLTATGTILVDQADVAIGDTEVHFDGITALPLAGDVFTVAGDTQTYVITSTSVLSTADADFTFQPPAVVAWADNAAVTFKASHRANLAFHRDAFAFCARPIAEDAQRLFPSAPMLTMQDPISKIPVRLEVMRQYKQTVFDLDILYGVKTLRRELACRIAG